MMLQRRPQVSQVKWQRVDYFEATEQRVVDWMVGRQVLDVAVEQKQVVFVGECAGKLSCQHGRMRFENIALDASGHIDRLSRHADQQITVAYAMVDDCGTMLACMLSQITEPDNLLFAFATTANPLSFSDWLPMFG